MKQLIMILFFLFIGSTFISAKVEGAILKESILKEETEYKVVGQEEDYYVLEEGKTKAYLKKSRFEIPLRPGSIVLSENDELTVRLMSKEKSSHLSLIACLGTLAFVPVLILLVQCRGKNHDEKG